MDKYRENLYDETMEAKADVVMHSIGKRLIIEEQLEFDELINKSQYLDIPKTAHEKVYEVVNDYKLREKIKKQKSILHKIERVCVITLICVGIFSVVFINNSEAFKYHFNNFIVEKYPQFLTLFAKDDNWGNDNTGTTISNIWYPNYVPEGFKRVNRVDRTNEIVLMFENNEGQTVKFCQSNATGVGIGLNNEGDAQGQIEVQDKYEGYWTSTDGNTALIWVQSDQLMEIYADIKIDEIFKIADSVVYHKK